MLLQIVALFLVILVLLFYLKWRRVKNYWAERNVPYLPPNPILGNLTFLMIENPAKWMRRMYSHFKSPYFGIWLFWRPCLIVNSPDIARDILVKDFGTFRDRYVSSGKSDPLGALNLFTVNDPMWSAMRRNLTRVFTASRLKLMQDYVQFKSQQLVEKISNEGNRIVDIKKMFTDYTTDVIGTSAFGVESNATLTGKGPLRNVTKEFSKFSLFRAMSWCSIFFFPKLVDIFRFKFYPQSSENYFKSIFSSIVTQREAAGMKNNHKDLLHLLLKIKKDSEENGEGYSEDFILAQAAIFLLAGFETTGLLITYCTCEIAHNLEVQEKLYQELVEAKKHNASDELDGTTLAELVYLDCILKETLRKFAPMGWLDRIASADYKIGDFTIKAGTVVYVNSVGMHYDPRYFPQPDVFNPDRFLPENEKTIHQYSYLPFGEGPRFCVGKRHALMTTKCAIASLVLSYQIRPLPFTPKPNDIKIDTRGLVYSPADPIALEFIPRKKIKC